MTHGEGRTRRRAITPGHALGAALRGMWAQSWRLFLANTALSLGVLPFLVAALWAPLALVGAALVAGPLAMALMHCAVELVREDDLSLRCWPAGLRLHWRRGLALGAGCALVVAAGVLAVATYAGAGRIVLAAVVLYLLLAFGVYQLALWPLAVAERAAPLRTVARAAVDVVLRAPLPATLLALALLLVNALGAAAALLPLLTLTLAFSSLAAAHFTLPRDPLQEAGS
ncbi:MAG TPA: hypothetical protein VLB86_10805 [Gaiellaceae bacterium]|nr:hypothetical protein [Gaiellaceae bacterium]